MTDEVVTCSSHNIYPVPQVTWATDPPSAQEALENSTIKTTDHRGLFTVASTLRILGNLSNYTYFCSFVSADKTQVWTASRKNQGAVMLRDDVVFIRRCLITNKRKKKHVCIPFRQYNTGRGSCAVHPMHRPTHSPEFLPHVDFHLVR